MQQLVRFLKELTGPARFCFATWLVALLSSIYAWLPFASPPAQLPGCLGLMAMAAGLVGFISMARHHLVTWEHRKAQQPTIRLQRGYWFVAIATLIYFLAVFFGNFIAYPSGVDLGPVVDLRIFSAVALFFSAFSWGFTQWADLRVRALLAAP